MNPPSLPENKGKEKGLAFYGEDLEEEANLDKKH